MQQKKRFGWVELVVGILLVILAIFTFVRPLLMLREFIVIYGILAIITGVADIVLYAKAERRMGFAPVLALITGILSIVVGFFLIFFPMTGYWLLAIFFPIWFIANCISRIANLGAVRHVYGKTFFALSLILNIAGIVLGFVMFFYPGITLLSISYILGAYMLVAGFDNIGRAFSKTA